MNPLFTSTSDWDLFELDGPNPIQMTRPLSNMKWRGRFRKCLFSLDKQLLDQAVTPE